MSLRSKPLQCFVWGSVSVLLFAASSLPAQDTVRDRDDAAYARAVAEALAAPAENLGRGYLFRKEMAELADLAQGGVRIVTPGGSVDKGNAAQAKAENELRLQAYAEAIGRRGYERIEGHYAIASVQKACARSGSMLLGGIAEGLVEGVDIRQSAFVTTLALVLAPDPEDAGEDPVPFEMEGVIVEATLAVPDLLNSDYFVLGTVTGDGIELRPDLSVLDGWPDWASPPRKADLQKCRVLLAKAP